MVGKKSGRALLREEGLQRTDNNMELTAWPQVNMINQKNYYTDFLKREDQMLANRLQQEEQLERRKKAHVDLDRARAQNGQAAPYPEPDDLDEDVPMDDIGNENYGSKTIVIHIGSQNLRIGFANDALPKTIPMVIARRAGRSEAEESEPLPKRVKLDEDAPPEDWFGEEFAREYNTMASHFKTLRRQNKRRVLPNSRELVTKWNSVTPPDIISEHNDVSRVDWTELPPDPAKAPAYIVGAPALRIPENSKPRYHLRWPIRHGWLNEEDYATRTLLLTDLFLILEDSIRTQLELPNKKEWSQYSCVFLIPDIYEKVVVSLVLHELIVDFGFSRVCFMQESLAATFGAGFSTACMVDIGAQKTAVCCVEDGMCIEDSRVNLKMGGFDVTETFVKMMLFDHLNYSDFNLMRRHDFLLAEELKEKYTTLSDENVSVLNYDFHLRAHDQPTRKYQFKLYDEGVLAPMGLFNPVIFDYPDKLAGRRKLISQSVDLYDGRPNDPIPAAQLSIVNNINQNLPSAVVAPAAKPVRLLGTPISIGTPSKPRPSAIPSHMNEDDGTPRSSPAASPPPDETGTPRQDVDAVNGDSILDIHGPQPDADLIERTVPILALDHAILHSIEHACKLQNQQVDERKKRDLLGSIMLTGGGSKTPNLQNFLEARLRAAMPQYPKEILVAPTPRDLDPSVMAWKGGSVFGKLRMTNDSWISPLEYDRLGARILNYKCMWHW